MNIQLIFAQVDCICYFPHTPKSLKKSGRQHFVPQGNKPGLTFDPNLRSVLIKSKPRKFKSLTQIAVADAEFDQKFRFTS